MYRDRKSLGFTIKSLSNQLKRVFDKRAIHDNTAGLTGMHFAVLGYIAEKVGEGKDVFQRDIERQFDVRRSTATTILQLMEKNGVLRREGVPGDLRLKRIVLTEKGCAIHERQGKHMAQTEAMLVEGVDPADLAAFYRVASIASRNIQRFLAETEKNKEGIE